MTTNFNFQKRDYIAVIVALILLLLFSLQQCQVKKNFLAEKEALLEAANDSLKIWKDKQGVEHAEKKILETSNVESFLNLKTKDKDILRLQEEVSKYKNKLGKSGSVSVIKGETVIDTFYTQPIIKYKNDLFYKDSIKNKWVNWVYEVVKDSTKNVNDIKFNLKLNYEYAVINKEKSAGWFKKPIYYSEIVNYNPYSKTLSLTTYKVTNEFKSKKWSIGPTISWGISSQFTMQPSIGIGLNYSLIRF